MRRKRIVPLVVSLCFVGSCLASPTIAFADAESAVVDTIEGTGSVVSEEDYATTLKRAGELLSQFIAGQKESGNQLFRDSFVQYAPVETADHEVRNKVLVECYFEDAEAVLAEIKPFMQENGISEDLVEMDYLAVKDLQVIRDALDTLIAQNSYDASTVMEDGSKVSVQFNPVPDGEAAPDRDAICTDIMDYCREHHLSTYLVKVEFLDEETPERKRACELLRQFVAEQKESGNPLTKNSFVELSSFETPDGVRQDKVLVSCYTADEEASRAAFRAFMQENEIREELVEICCGEPMPEGTPEDRALAEKVAAFLAEQGYKVHITYLDEETQNAFEGKTIEMLFDQAPYLQEYDRAALTQMIEDYCTEQQLDYSRLMIGFQESAPAGVEVPEETSSSPEEPAGEESAPASQSEPAEEESAPASQSEPTEEDSSPASQDGTTGEDTPVMPEPVSEDTGSSAAELPQTGYFGFGRLVAGLGALMVAAGTAIVVKTRKENN
ncbi:MAG: hypothetical protein IKN55_03215 [Oscillospiraceae bacterium]|nr:hypothetical protein [Oscillospiraceae bacterium]